MSPFVWLSRKAIKVREHGLDGHSSAVLANAILLMSYVAHRAAVPLLLALPCMNDLDFYNNDFLLGPSKYHVVLDFKQTLEGQSNKYLSFDFGVSHINLCLITESADFN